MFSGSTSFSPTVRSWRGCSAAGCSHGRFCQLILARRCRSGFVARPVAPIDSRLANASAVRLPMIASLRHARRMTTLAVLLHRTRASFLTSGHCGNPGADGSKGRPVELGDPCPGSRGRLHARSVVGRGHVPPRLFGRRCRVAHSAPGSGEPGAGLWTGRWKMKRRTTCRKLSY